MSSSPSSLSDFSPRLGRRYHTFTPLGRNTLNRVWQRKTVKDDLSSFYTRQAEGLPFIPSYLTKTVYAQLIKQQYAFYKEHCESTRDSTEGESSSSSDQTKRLTPTAHEIESLHSSLSKDSPKMQLLLQDLRLPTSWDIKAKGDHTDISTNRLQLTYTGSGKDNDDVSSTRANHAMRKQCGIYYFEVQVISKGIDGRIGIGFCRKINSLDRLPGWEEHSWGYHGENGNVFSGPGTGKSYGPKYGTGDIIGCGIDFRDMSAFYTKNGILLGTAFRKIKDTELYPFVGFKTPGEKIEANFGSKPFKFDIQQYLSNEKHELLNCITVKSTTTPRSETVNDFEAKTIADNVVLEYLKHNGYEKAAKSLKKSIVLKNDESADDDDMNSESLHRQEIRKALLDGEIDRVFELCSEHYPNVLEKNPMVLFRLKCRKFMEMVKRVQSEKKQFSQFAKDAYETQLLEISENTIPTKRNAKSNSFKKKKQKVDKDTDLNAFSAVMAFGNKLKKEYEEEYKSNNAIRSELLIAFSTLAYTDLSDPAVAYLFETPQLELVASELNSAILVSLGKYPNSSLERIYRQTNEIIELLVLSGNAKAALLHPEQDCLNSKSS